MHHVEFITTPDDGSCGIGKYTTNLIKQFEDQRKTTRTHLHQDRNKNVIYFLLIALRSVYTDSDIIHVQHEYELFRGSPLNLPGFHTFTLYTILLPYCVISHTPLITTMHTVYETNNEDQPLRAVMYLCTLHKFILLVSNRVILLSETTYSELDDIKHNNCCVHLSHGVKASDTELDSDDAKQNFGYCSDDVVVALPGYIEHRKGHDIFIQIADSLSNYEFLVAGGAPTEESAQYQSTLKSKAGQNVQFTGILSDQMFRLSFEAADIVVLPYRKISQSGILNLCVAHRVPVIASSLPYFENLSDQNIVYVCDRSVEQMCNQITNIITDQSMREKMRKSMDDYAMENSLQTIANRHIEIYSELIKTR